MFSNDRAHGMYILHVDVLVIHDDGCLLDACLSAALAALSSAKWPRLEATESEGLTTAASIKFVATTGSVQLLLSDWPLAFTFAIVPSPVAGNSLLAQPSRRELLLWDTDATLLRVAMDAKGQLVDFSLTGGFVSSLSSHLGSVGVCNDGNNDLVFANAIAWASKQAQLIRNDICKQRANNK